MSRSERRREAREAPSGMTKFYVILGGVAAVAVAGVGLTVTSRGGATALAPIDIGVLDDQALVEMAQGVPRGDENAPVTIIEFGDFQCPGCQYFATQVEPQIRSAYVDSGKAQFVFYDWPIITAHPNAFVAARSARCADDQGKFWEYHDYLYRNQSQWATLTSPIGLFVDYADLLEMDKGAFESCVRSDRHADLVTANMELGERLGVDGTPTVLIAKDGASRRVEVDLESIQSYVDGLLEPAEATN